jgi:hypothetical protein
MNEQMQALAFLAGANSIFYGEKLLTTANPQADKDMQLFARLGIKPAREEHADEVHQAAIEQAGRAAQQRCSTTQPRPEHGLRPRRGWPNGVPRTSTVSGHCCRARRGRKWWSTASRCWPSAATTTWAWPTTPR